MIIVKYIKCNFLNCSWIHEDKYKINEGRKFGYSIFDLNNMSDVKVGYNEILVPGLFWKVHSNGTPDYFKYYFNFKIPSHFTSKWIPPTFNIAAYVKDL